MSNWLAIYTNSNTAAGWTKQARSHNVDILYKYFKRQGWNIAPLAAMLGNMEYESYLNPGQWEHGIAIETTGGFGLVQWTPYTKFSNWAGVNWRTDYDLQMQRIQYELENGLQWIPTTVYNFSFYDFSRKKKSQMSIADLTRAFEYCYERGTWDNQRIVNAEYWYKYLKKKELLFLIELDSASKKRVKGAYIY